MAVPITFKLAGRGSGFLQDLGFVSGPRGNASAWAFAILLAVAYIIFTMGGIPLVAQHWRALSWLKGLSVLAAIAAGIVEEAFFRRLIMDALEKAGARVWMQIAASGLAFGAAHGMWGLLGGSAHVAVGAALTTTVLGLGLAAIYVLGARSLAPCIMAHFLIDLVIEPGLLLAAVNGKM